MEEGIVDIVETALFGRFWGIPNILWLVGLYFLLNAIVPRLMNIFTRTAESHYYYDTGAPNPAEKGWIFLRRGWLLFLRSMIKLGLIAWIILGTTAFLAAVAAFWYNARNLPPWFSAWTMNSYIVPALAGLCISVSGIGSLVYFLSRLDEGKTDADFYHRMELLRAAVTSVLAFAVFLLFGAGLLFALMAILFMAIPVFKELWIRRRKRELKPGAKPLLPPVEDAKETDRKPEW
jgi:hypothetical protein